MRSQESKARYKRYRMSEAYRALARAYARKKRDELYETINRLKMVPCVDCKVQYSPWIMDFDHKNPKEKVAGISRLISNNADLEKILEEIKKCDVICANCHRERTYNQRLNGEI